MNMNNPMKYDDCVFKTSCDVDKSIKHEFREEFRKKSEKFIQKAIEGMHDSRTILVIAHRLSTVTKADKILVLAAGKIVESGTKDELLTENGIFSKLWATQYR